MDASAVDALLARFQFDVDPPLRELLITTLSEAVRDARVEFRDFELNTVDIRYDFKQRIVTIYDVLAAGDEISLIFEQFETLLIQHKSPAIASDL